METNRKNETVSKNSNKGPKRRDAVILFADIIGCSEISNEHSVEEYSEIL